MLTNSALKVMFWDSVIEVRLMIERSSFTYGWLRTFPITRGMVPNAYPREARGPGALGSMKAPQLKYVATPAGAENVPSDFSVQPVLLAWATLPTLNDDEVELSNGWPGTRS